MNHPLLLTLVIYAAGLGAAGQFSKLAVSFVTLSQAYGGHETTLGLAVSLISLVGVFLGLVAGMVVTRIGTKRAMMAALVLGAVISFWQASLPALPFLLASRVLEGLSHLLIVVAAPTLIAGHVADRFRSAALTLWSTFFGVAFALTAAIAPWVIGAFGLGTLIFSHGVWMLAAAALCGWVLPHPQTTPPRKLKLSEVFARHIRAYATPGIVTPAIAWLCYTLTFVSVLTTLPLLTQGNTPEWLPALAPLVSISVALTLGITVLSRVPALKVVVGGFTLCLCAVLIIAGFGFAAAPILLLFASMAFVQGAGFAVVPQLNKTTDERALANGALAQMGNIGNLSGTPILITLYQGAPFVGPLLFLCTAYTIVVMASWHLGRRAQGLADRG